MHRSAVWATPILISLQTPDSREHERLRGGYGS